MRRESAAKDLAEKEIKASDVPAELQGAGRRQFAAVGSVAERGESD